MWRGAHGDLLRYKLLTIVSTLIEPSRNRNGESALQPPPLFGVLRLLFSDVHLQCRRVVSSTWRHGTHGGVLIYELLTIIVSPVCLHCRVSSSHLVTPMARVLCSHPRCSVSSASSFPTDTRNVAARCPRCCAACRAPAVSSATGRCPRCWRTSRWKIRFDTARAAANSPSTTVSSPLMAVSSLLLRTKPK